ncbi:MAG: nuclear transport factor 2 family protein [Chlorobi bacterium]|nr:nuclear transport factor 2 family protein [Chlorobiota bacterium]MCI0716875.1 nuclear transport factor 2 family protein [Chlorobiota bacterium]
MNNTKTWLEGIGKTIDAKNAKAFSEYITEDGSFRFGNQPEVAGRKAIEGYVAEFFKMLKASQHEIINWWDNNDHIIWEGRVTYTRLDDKKVVVNFTNVFYMKNGLIDKYNIYIDNTPLFAN